MRQLAAKIKPATGFSHVFHLLLMALLPALLFVLVRMDFVPLAFVLVLLSKWRMLAVKPRHWPANIRANGIDLIVGLSVVVFMAHSGTQLWQFIWALIYAFWLIVIKPGSGTLMISLQALLGQVAGLMAVFMAFGSAHQAALVGLVWLVCYMAARHFYTIFDESLTRFLSHLWGYFGAALTWVLSHWLLFYGVVAQPTLLLTVLGFGLAGLYYLEKRDRLSILLRRQVVFVMIAVVVIVIAFSEWGDKTI